MANQIKARITADATGFTAGLKRATSALDGATQRWERQFAGLNRGLAAFGGFIAGGVAAGALDAFAKSALDLGGAIDDAAKTAGIGAAALQEYRFAAKQSGLEVEALDKAISTFVRNLGEARRGNKALAETFARIGVVAADTNERALEKTFQFLAGVGDHAQRASLAAELFGARAQRMATLVEGGVKTLSDFRQQARDLGIVLDDSLIAKADEAGDRIDALETIMRARLNRTVLENIDGFVRFKELLNDSARGLVEMAANVGKLTAAFERHFAVVNRDAISDALPAEELLKRRNKLLAAVASNDRQIKKNEKSLVDQAFPGILKAAQKNIADLEADNQILKARVDEIDAALLRQIQTIVNSPAGASPPPPVAPPAGGGVNARNPFPGLGAPTLKSDALKKAAEEAGKSIESITSKVKTPFEELRDQLEEIQSLMPFAENAEELELLGRAGASVEAQMRALQVQTKLWGVTLDDVARGLSDAFANAIVNGENLLGTLKRLVKQLAARALSNLLFKQIGAALGVPALPGLASGGPVVAGRSYLVGEQGPEVFTPSVSGAIIPNGAFSNGGISVQVVNRFDVGLESVDQRIGSLTPAISASVVEAVQRANARPRYA